MSERLTVPLLVVAFGIAMAVGVCADNYYLTVVLSALLLGLFAAASDLAIGVAGVLSLGSALYFGLGAYAVAVAQRADWGFGGGLLLALFIGAAVAGVLGVVGLTSRKSSIQFALVTLIASLTCEQVIINYDFLGRSNGLPGVQLPTLFGTVVSLRVYYLVCTVVVFVVLAGLHRFARSRYGRLLILVRDQPDKAESFGYGVKSIKVAATAVSAAISAACGGAYVVVIGIAFPGMFSALPNMLLLVWIALGGPGSLCGPFLAAILIKLIEFRLGRSYTDTYMLILGVVFVLVVSFVPGGLWGIPLLRRSAK